MQAPARPSRAAAALAAALGLLFAGCGREEASPAPARPPATATPKPAAAKPAAAGNATAEEVAKQARGDLSCPPQLSAPPRDAQAPVDDIQGVRPGLAFDEAMRAVLCTNERLVAAVERGRGFNLKAPRASEIRQGFGARHAEARTVKTSREIVQEMQNEAIARSGNAVREDLQPGQAKWFVGTMGAPGQERVLSVAREERYAADQRPTVERTLEALVAKYGRPSMLHPGSAGRMPMLRWTYDPAGRSVAEGAALFHRCSGVSDPNGSVNVAPDCGVVVQAMLVPHRDNPELVDRLQVGVVDQARGWDLIAAAERGLGEQDAQRRAQEVDKAARGGKAPTL